jgi:hypothetical protein
VEEVGTPAKDLRFVVALEPEALPHMEMAEPRFQGRERGSLSGGDLR